MFKKREVELRLEFLNVLQHVTDSHNRLNEVQALPGCFNFINKDF